MAASDRPELLRERMRAGGILAADLAQLKADSAALAPGDGQAQREKKKKKTEKKQKKERKHRRGRSGNSSPYDSKGRRRSRRGRPASNSSSSDSQSRSRSRDGVRYVRWKDGARKGHDIDPAAIPKIDQMEAQRPADLKAFAIKHRGALTAHFLAMVRQRLMGGYPTTTGELRQVDAVTWVERVSGITDPIAKREASTPCHVLDNVNRRDAPRALDILSMRLWAIQLAALKVPRENATMIELIPGNDPVTPGLAQSAMPKA